MQKVRVQEVINETGAKSKDVLDKAKELGFNVKTVSSTLSQEEAEELFNYVLTGKNPRPNPAPQKKKKTATAQKSEAQEASETKEDKKTKSKSSKKGGEETPKTKSKTEEKPQKKSTKSTKTEQKKQGKEEGSEEKITQSSLDSQPKEEIPEAVAPVANQEPPKESLAKATVQKRVGLRIIKKRNNEGGQKDSSKETKSGVSSGIKSLQALLGETESNYERKKKKEKKKSLASSSKKHEHKIDLLSDRNLSSSSDFDDEQDEVMLFDLTIRDEKEEQDEEVVKRVDANRIRGQKRAPLFEQGIRRSRRKKPPKSANTKQESTSSEIEIPEEIRAYEFAQKTNKSVGEVIKVLFNLGLMVTKNDFLDRDSLEILAEEFGINIVIKNTSEALEYTTEYEDATEDETLVERPPVVTIMGHVDHGKTSLLDKIRNTRVASGEAGGITQHIGAYTVTKNGKKISFIDTPGHEAFSEMRARGAEATDIVIIVIAADDGIKQQTIEALSHAKAANVPIIIALNKIDKPDANPDKVKAEASDLGYSPLEWGGEYEFVHISAKTGEGIDHLLETILIQSELLELRANPNKAAKAVVIESSLEKGKGPIATLIVQNGTLKVGDSIVADTAYGRVRALLDDFGQNIQSVGPSEVAVVAGLSEAPMAGAILISVENDAIARDYAEKRALYLRQKELSRSTKVSLDELSSMVAEGQLKTLPVIIKTDTQGSLEAIRSSLEKLRNEEVRVNVIHSGVGGITESDVILAGASHNSVILGFNVRPTGSVKNRAKELHVEVKTYSIIYALLDDIKAVLGGMMSPILEEENTGQAEVRETFVIAKVGTVAGCFVVDGSIQRGIKVRLIRQGVVVFTGNIASLKRFKDDAKEVAKGHECGIMLEGYNDIQVGDVFETYKEVQKARKL
ncbi:MAG: translation initiation factor IF-2 [Wolinella sp.]